MSRRTKNRTNTPTKIFSFAFAALAGLAIAAAPATQAQAGDYHCTRQVWVTTWKYQKVPYQVCVVKYTPCGRAYETYETAYRTVRVPVKKLVTVAY